MFCYDFLLIFVAVFFLSICSYQDIKTRTISNKLVFYFLIVAFLLKLTQAIIQNNFSILLSVFLSFIITFIICYVFWELGIIAGGDLKILLVISILSPQITIFSKTFPFFAIVLLFLGFLVLAPYIFIYSLIKLFSKPKRKHLRSILTKSKATNTLTTIFALFFINSFLNIFSIYLSFVSLFVISFILVILFSKIIILLKNKWSIFLLFILYFCLFFYSLISKTVVFDLNSFVFLFFTIFTFTIVFSLTKIITEEVLVDKKKIYQLQDGDVPTHNYYLIKNKLFSKKLTFKKTVKLLITNQYYKDLKIDSKKAGGLSKEDVSFLKKHYKKNLSKKISVKKTIPFTPTLLISYIILLFV